MTRFPSRTDDFRSKRHRTPVGPTVRALVFAAAVATLVACGGPAVPDGGGPPGGECAVTIAGDITIPTRLTNHADGCDYRVEGSVRVTGALVIDAGTEIQFAQDS